VDDLYGANFRAHLWKKGGKSRLKAVNLKMMKNMKSFSNVGMAGCPVLRRQKWWMTCSHEQRVARRSKFLAGQKHGRLEPKLRLRRDIDCIGVAEDRIYLVELSTVLQEVGKVRRRAGIYCYM